MSGPASRENEMTTTIEQLDAMSSVAEEAIEETRHPYEHATPTERADYDRKIATVEDKREARERAAASIPG